MTMPDARACAMLSLLFAAATPAAQQPPPWMTEGPRVEADAFAFEVPVEVLGNLVFVEVELGGRPRRFLFDTGSPSMMGTALAGELGLQAVDHRQGRDSHGAVVDTSVVQADLTLGGTTIRKVPVFVADFPKTARCLFDGVLGSELLPLCAWQLDLPDGVLRCDTSTARLDHLQGEALALHDFGYPHAPILDIGLAEDAHSKALLDTGSPEYMAISPPDLEGARRSRGVGRTVEGEGSIGGSIGGAAPARTQQMVELRALSIGDQPLGRIGAVLRESPPSLLGAALLQHYVVTLDARGGKAWFDRYRDGPFARPSFGFGVSFEDAATVSLVWQDSPAHAAGLRVGQRVTAIDGQAVDKDCTHVRATMRAMSERDTLAVEWDGGAATLSRRVLLTH